MQYINPSQADTKVENQRWILWFNPNGATYEEEFGFLVSYARDMCCNVLAFNYR